MKKKIQVSPRFDQFYLLEFSREDFQGWFNLYQPTVSRTHTFWTNDFLDYTLFVVRFRTSKNVSKTINDHTNKQNLIVFTLFITISIQICRSKCKKYHDRHFTNGWRSSADTYTQKIGYNNLSGADIHLEYIFCMTYFLTLVHALNL